MKQLIHATILRNEEIAPQIYSIWFEAPYLAKAAKPGQFVEVYIKDNAHMLPRPLSICDCNTHKGLVRLVYQQVGQGTAWLSHLKPRQKVTVMGPLGNGFALQEVAQHVLVGGGIGIPPLLFLAKQIKAQKGYANIFLGFRSGRFLYKEFEKLGFGVSIATDDGSVGFHGHVVALMEKVNVNTGCIYACGPKAMLQGVADFAQSRELPCLVSMEERMACGVGACVGCVVKVADDSAEEGWAYKKVCHDGPVFNSREVIWHG